MVPAPDKRSSGVADAAEAPSPTHQCHTATLFIDDHSEVQPDVIAFRDVLLGDRIRLTADDFLEGVPDLVADVAESGASYDLHAKLQVYERAGVPEYLVWQLHERRLSWFRLTNGRYVEVQPDAGGVIEGSVFPGLRLPVEKLLAGDDAGVLAALS
jgi:Uma2 family endonuclease